MRVLALLLFVAAIQESAPATPLERGRAKFEEARKAEKAGGDFVSAGIAAIAAFDEAVKADATSVEARAGRASGAGRPIRAPRPAGP